MTRNLTSLKEASGPDFEKWAQAIARGVVKKVRGSRRLDEVRDEV